MDSQTLISLILRALQLLFAAIVLGTSISLARWLPSFQDSCNAAFQDRYCDFHGLIHAVRFVAVVGALALLDALVGLVAAFVEAIPVVVVLGLDAVVAVVDLAGGLSISIILSKTAFDRWDGSRATMSKADAAFNFLGFLVTLAILATTFLWRRSGRLGSAV